MRYSKNIISILLFVILFIAISCKNETTKKYLPFVINYFPKSEIKSYSFLKVENEKGKLKVDGDLIRELDYIKLKFHDTINIKLPDEYRIIENDSSNLMKTFKDKNGNILNFQILSNSTESSFDFFRELYELSIIRDYKFNLSSAILFKSKVSNFVTYDVHVVMNGIDKYVLGLIYTQNNKEYVDMTLINSIPIKKDDRIIFSEAINSLKIRSKKIIPYYDEIIKEISINLD